MFQLQFGVTETWKREKKINNLFTSDFSRDQIKTIYEVNWEEHCVECAVPHCYTTCSLFRKRSDGACSRFEYGIIGNNEFRGFSEGADIRFKKWAKLEAELVLAIPVAPDNTNLMQKYWSKAYAIKKRFRQRAFKNRNASDSEPLYLLLECFSPSQEDFLLIIEYFILDDQRIRTSLFRHSVLIKFGKNAFAIPCTHLNLFQRGGYFHLYPENSEPTKRLIFTWLHFANLNAPLKLEKVKCLAWDLDNTLWSGIIGDQMPIAPNPAAIELIKDLDERGVLQTIVSKNDFSQAWPKIQELGLDKYFLYPKINWNPKSENLSIVSKELNISTRHIALIDDSTFEREEVRTRLNDVRVYSNNEISRIIEYPEFDHPLTKNSKHRRGQYQTEIERSNFKTSTSAPYDEFLKACRMTLRIFRPATSDDIERCHELVQRTNQLNLSFNRYSKDELTQLISKSEILPLALQCDDKFGDYGIIGFCTIDLSGRRAKLVDFVISCRIAQKKVEQTFLHELMKFFKAKRRTTLAIRLRTSPLNLPLLKVFEDLDLDFYKEGPEYTASLTLKYFGNGLEIMTVIFDA